LWQGFTEIPPLTGTEYRQNTDIASYEIDVMSVLVTYCLYLHNGHDGTENHNEYNL